MPGICFQNTGEILGSIVSGRLQSTDDGSDRAIIFVNFGRSYIHGGLQFLGIRRLSTSVGKSPDLKRVVISRSMREIGSRRRIE